MRPIDIVEREINSNINFPSKYSFLILTFVITILALTLLGFLINSIKLSKINKRLSDLFIYGSILSSMGTLHRSSSEPQDTALLIEALTLKNMREYVWRKAKIDTILWLLSSTTLFSELTAKLFIDKHNYPWCSSHWTLEDIDDFIEEKKIIRLGCSKAVPVNVVLILATNKNLEEMVQTGAFREDLYYRIKWMVIQIPALREWGLNDIHAIAKYFIGQWAIYQKDRLDPNYQRIDKTAHIVRNLVEKSLCEFNRYYFKGNVRELKNLIEQACKNIDMEQSEGRFIFKDNAVFETFSGEHSDNGVFKKRLSDIFSEISSDSGEGLYKRFMSECEKSLLLYILNQNNGNLTKSAIQLIKDINYSDC
jgi:hypothetical protein